MIINKKKSHKKIIIIFTLIVLLFLITIILVKYNQKLKQQRLWEQNVERVKKYTAITDFQNMEEVSAYLNCKFIKQQDSERENIAYDIFMELPVNFENETTENKNFIENLIQFSAYVLKYKNFVILDEKNNTSLVVLCNEEKQIVSTYYINNIENYFDIIENKENIGNFKTTQTSQMDITSQELEQLIENNWQLNKIDLGTKESFYRNYDIYFDEGIQIRKVNGKVFNIIFTDKYQNTIVNNLNANSTIDEIKNSLGKPQFENGNLIGYKGDKLYVFFCDNQVSVYRIEEYETEKIAEIIENKSSENSNEKVFVDEIRNIWKDYDIYIYDENYVKLQYTLKSPYYKNKMY